MPVIISRVKSLGKNNLRKKVCIMRRSRAFILSEILMTILLQAGLILALCSSFYLLLSFYAKAQQVLVAKNHADRVIQFVDGKIRHTGLGLWKCHDSQAIRDKLDNIVMLYGDNTKAYRLPLALQWKKDSLDQTKATIPLKSSEQDEGDVMTLLYAQKDVSSGDDNEIISLFSKEKQLSPEMYDASTWGAALTLLDANSLDRLKNNSLFDFSSSSPSNIKKYAVIERLGVPLYLNRVLNGKLEVKVFNMTSSQSRDITIPAAGDLLSLAAMQMFVQDEGDGQGRQFSFRRLSTGGASWGGTYHQEKNILDIYMERDTNKRIFTLYVLATGGYDAEASNPRPDTWPKDATPSGSTDSAAKQAWLASEYCHHVVYVSRATWKLNNIPPNFTWN